MQTFKDMFEVMRDNRARVSRMRNMLTGSLMPLMQKRGLPPRFLAMAVRMAEAKEVFYLLLPMRDAELLVAHNINDSDTLTSARIIREMLVDAYRDQREYILLKVG